MDRVEFVPGQSLPLFELKPPVFEGIDFFVKRSFDIVGSALLILVSVADAGGDRARDPGDSRGRCDLPLDAAGHRRRAVRLLQVPDDVPGRRAPAARARGAQREGGRALQDPRRPARHAASGASCGAGRSTSCRSCFNVLRGEMSLVGPRPLPERDYERLEDWHRKRYLVLPGMTGLWQVSGRAGARLRRAGAARLPLPRALVGLPRPLDHAEDDPGRDQRRGAW